jgi:TRAP-type C4-dicarboxylate transport system permease large subunit
MEIGFVHPPLGFKVYVIHSLARDISLGTIFRGIIPFLASDFVHLAMLIFIPATVMWLPTILAH